MHILLHAAACISSGPGPVGMPTWCWRPVLAAGRMARHGTAWHGAGGMLVLIPAMRPWIFGKNEHFFVNMCGYYNFNGTSWIS